MDKSYQTLQQNILDKYNVPVPRYTSYPPANCFGDYTEEDYARAVGLSNTESDRRLSFYIHLPFCHSLCLYCACNATAMPRSEAVDDYIRALHREIDLLRPLIDGDRLTAQIHYGGGSPTAMPTDVIRGLNEHLTTAFGTTDEPEIAIECHPGYLTMGDWQGLTEAGFTRFSIGIQDFDERVLRAVGRRPPRERMDDVIGLLRAAGAKVSLDLLCGLPLQTPDSFRRTTAEAIRLMPDRVVVFGYAHVPWLKPRQRALERIGLPAGKEKERMMSEAARMLKEAGYERVGMDHFVRPDDELWTARQRGQLHRNFQGYCTRRTTAQVYAFGASGISQLATAYAQNTRDVDEYVGMVSEGRMPVSRGYDLSSREQRVRDVIDMLMCNYAVTLSDEQRAAVNFDVARLKEMEADGIITLEGSTISMTQEGSPFVRNVAALLDPVMQQNRKTFSKPI